MLTNRKLDRFILKRMNRNKVGRDNLELMVIDTEDER